MKCLDRSDFLCLTLFDLSELTFLKSLDIQTAAQ
jgi:hypothetical protein